MKNQINCVIFLDSFTWNETPTKDEQLGYIFTQNMDETECKNCGKFYTYLDYGEDNLRHVIARTLKEDEPAGLSALMTRQPSCCAISVCARC